MDPIRNPFAPGAGTTAWNNIDYCEFTDNSNNSD